MITATTRRPAKTESKLVELIPSAAYVRMSTDQQDGSPERQKMQINDYAARHGHKIIRWYSDHGMTGTESRKRTGYQQLLADAKLGVFEAVLIAELSRMSREDLFSVIPQWSIFRDNGIQLVSCQQGAIDFGSMGGLLTAVINQFSSHDESKKLADRVVTGKLTRLLNGHRVDGKRLFGFDRNIVDAGGYVLKRVHYREKFTKSIDCKSQLVPSADGESVKAIQWAFKHVSTGGSLGSVVREFNQLGLVGTFGKPFTVGTVRQILTNPTYAGHTLAGNECSGKFRRISDSHGPLLQKNTHAPLVDQQTFDLVSGMFLARANSHETWRTYLLSGLCRCGHCGLPMSGVRHGDEPHQYRCPSTRNEKLNGRCEVHPSFTGLMVEKAVIRAWCDVYLTDDVSSQIKLKPAEDHSKHDQQELKSLADQIERGEKNLTLAESNEDFRAVSQVLTNLRKREAELRNKLSKENRKLADLAPEILQSVKELKDSRDLLLDWPNVGSEKDLERLTRELSIVFKQTISSVILRMDREKNTAKSDVPFFRRRTGTVIFNQQHVGAPDAVLTDDMLANAQRRQYRRVAQILRDNGRVMTSREIMEQLGTDRIYRVHRAMRMCYHEGLVERSGDGWIARQ